MTCGRKAFKTHYTGRFLVSPVPHAKCIKFHQTWSLPHACTGMEADTNEEHLLLQYGVYLLPLDSSPALSPLVKCLSYLSEIIVSHGFCELYHIFQDSVPFGSSVH